MSYNSKYKNKAKFNNANSVLSTLVSFHLRVMHHFNSMDLNINSLFLPYFDILIKNKTKNYLIHN